LEAVDGNSGNAKSAIEIISQFVGEMRIPTTIERAKEH
jgi:hypothetical protein